MTGSNVTDWRRPAAVASERSARPFVYIVILGSLLASTGARAERIAVEAYVGARPADAERVMQTLRPMLADAGFTVDATSLAKRFSMHDSRPGGSKALGPKIHKMIEDGIRAYEDLKPARAVKGLAAALVLARENSVAWANEPKYKDQVRRGMLYYALALQLLADTHRDEAGKKSTSSASREQLLREAGESEAARDDAIEDLIRSFPAFIPSREQYGMGAETLHREARARLDKLGRGSLELDVDDPNAVVYLDESIQPRRTTVGDLVPGVHRVLVVSIDGARVYDVEVLANQRSRLPIRLALDSQLVLRPWVGFLFRTTDNRRVYESQFVADLIGRNTDGVLAAVITVSKEGSRASVAGTVYNARTGEASHRCSAAMSRAGDTSTLVRFAQCLGGKKPDGITRISLAQKPSGEASSEAPAAANEPSTSDVVTAVEAPPSLLREFSTSEERGSPTLSVVVAGVGVAAIGVGVYLCLTVEPSPVGVQPERLYSVPGNALIAGGAVVSALGAYLWYRAATGASKSSAPTVNTSSRSVTVGWSASF